MNLAILDGICIYPTETGQRAFCPECGGAVMSKVGAIKEPHWAHLVETNCEGYYKPMSKWHREWQLKFPKEWREVYTKKDGEVCIADVKTPRGTTIEFQHSNISKDNIAKRKRVHGDVFWVLDGGIYLSGVEYIKGIEEIELSFIGTESTGFEDIQDFTKDYNYRYERHYRRQLIKEYEDTTDYGSPNSPPTIYTYKYIVILKSRYFIPINQWYAVAYRFSRDILEAKKDDSFMNGSELDINTKGNLNFKIEPTHTDKKILHIDKDAMRFFNSNGVFIDKAKGVPNDSLLQVFEDGTFKIFKKEGFIDRLLSHSQNNNELQAHAKSDNVLLPKPISK